MRGALFSSLASDVEDAVVLDAFCGSGAFGIEALSRGAAHVTFQDKDTRPLKLNLPLIKEYSHDTLMGDFLKVAHALGRKYDIIFIDPPYGVYDTADVLQLIYDNALLKENGVILYEESVRTPFSCPEECFDLIREKRYGDTVVYFLSGKE